MSLFPLLLTMATASAQDAPPPIVNGQTTSDWPAVGVLMLSEGSGPLTPFCSGTLVASDQVVTAAHCVDAAEEYRDLYGLDIHFGIGPSVEEIERTIEVGEMDSHPDYFFDNTGIGADVAVMSLTSPVSGVEPMPLYTDAFDANFLRGDLTLVGFGITGDNRDDAGTKRTATLPMKQADADFVYAVDDDPDGSNACQGDSGGAALVPVGDGWALAGVLSFVFPYHDASHYCIGGGVGATRMDVYGDWVLPDGVVDGGGDDGDGGTSGGSGDDGGGGTSPASSIFGDDKGGCSLAPAGGGLFAVGMLLLGLARRQNSRV
ncbi:MAG: trypsin-like serine protease [Alphaproteobacteria bacterium]|nr:trypsin-like serine protease [Alphaproteobacteria bacterium]